MADETGADRRRRGKPQRETDGVAGEATRAVVIVPILGRQPERDEESSRPRLARSPQARHDEAVGLTRAIDLDPVRTGHELVRRQITVMVEDVIGEAQRRIAAAHPRGVEEVHGQKQTLVAFSDAMREDEKLLKRFLYKNLYFHETVVVRRQAADRIVRDLFDACFNDAAVMPPEWQAGLESLDKAGRARRVADYLAGMTDNYAVREHRRLFDHTPDLA